MGLYERSRHAFRAKWHDYNNGIYFVTACCDNYRHFLGKINNGKMALSPCGEELNRQFFDLENRHKDTKLVNFVIMPNHFHCLLVIEGNPTVSNSRIGALRINITEGDQFTHFNSRLANIIGGIKAGVTRFANKNHLSFKWQSRFHDYIVRDQAAFDNINNYIETNVEFWHKDRFMQEFD